jgi:hypothetical protein
MLVAAASAGSISELKAKKNLKKQSAVASNVPCSFTEGAGVVEGKGRLRESPKHFSIEA